MVLLGAVWRGEAAGTGLLGSNVKRGEEATMASRSFMEYGLINVKRAGAMPDGSES